MSIKSSVLWLMAAMCVASCSNDDALIDPDQTGAAGEIQLLFNGNGHQEEYTRAIASDAENDIESLRVYVFASANETDYFYQEMWSTENGTPADKALVLQGIGGSKKASIFPTEWKTMPYLKFYCVANSSLYTAADGTTEATLTAITGDADGNPQTAGVTTSTVFEALTSATVSATAPITVPLAMKGEATAMFKGNFSKLEVEMKRVMARFDIDNDAARTMLTIKKVIVEQAQPRTTVFGTTTGVATAPAGLVTYPVVQYQALPHANAGLTESALYIYPGTGADQSIIRIEGDFMNPVTKEVASVVYRLPIVKQPSTAVQPGTPAEYIDLTHNHRYTLRISQATQAGASATLEIEDWTSGGGVAVKPDADEKPILSSIDAGATGATFTAGETTIALTTDGDLTLVTRSSSRVEATIGTIGSILTRSVTDWLTAKPGETKYESVDGKMQTTFVFTVAGVTDAVTACIPQTIRLVSKTASNDPDLATVITVCPPVMAPEATLSAAYSSGQNSIDLVAGTALMYKMQGGKLYLDVTSPYGTDVTTDKAANELAVTRVATNGLTQTYSLTLLDLAITDNDATATVTLTNRGDDTKSVVLTLSFEDSAIGAVTCTSVGVVSGTDDAEGTFTISIDQLVDRAFDLTVASPAGVAPPAEVPGFTLVEKTPFAAGTTVYTVTVAADATFITPTDVTFENLIPGGASKTIKFN